jgi:hypothetical protein
MSLRKQEFYEGAALHVLAKTGRIRSIRHEEPFFVVNDNQLLLLKYSTRGRSPWGFTFTPVEQAELKLSARSKILRLGLICGHDGVATIDYNSYALISGQQGKAIWISCIRDHGEHYEIKGPLGSIPRKIAPAAWSRILDEETVQ